MEAKIRSHLISNGINSNKICRICLSTENENILLCLFDSENIGLQEKIMLCTRIQIECEDGMPSSICLSCAGELIQVNNFRVKCENSDKFLRQIVNQQLVSSTKDNVERVEETKIEIKQEKLDDLFYKPNLNKICDQENDPVDENSTYEDIKMCKSDEEGQDYGDCKQINHTKESNPNIVCDSCDVLFITQSELHIHQQLFHHGIINSVETNLERATLKEKVNGSLVKKQRKLGRKLKMNFDGRIIDTVSKKIYQCLECEYNTPYKKSLVYHVRTHTGEKPNVCEVCHKGFTQPGSLTAHRKIHSDKMYFTCPICGKQFKYKQKYERHKSVHSTEKKFICTLCHKGLKSKMSLKNHMDRHNNIKNYSCETCGSTFVTSSELINHSMIHKNDRKFSCHICKFKTYKKAGLEKHLKHHSGEKPYQCDHCNLSYCSKGELTCHIKRHTREKRYGCTVCLQRFNHSPSLNRHMLKIHGVQFKWKDVVDRRVVK